MSAAVESQKRVEQFPEEKVRAALVEFWRNEALDRTDDPFGSARKANCTLYDLLPSLDSLTIVRSFNIMEKILGYRVPVALVKPGGYYSQEEMLKDLLPKMRKFYNSKSPA